MPILRNCICPVQRYTCESSGYPKYTVQGKDFLKHVLTLFTSFTYTEFIRNANKGTQEVSPKKNGINVGFPYEGGINNLYLQISSLKDSSL